MPGEEFQTSQPQPSIWERGAADARTILYYLSKDKKVLEVIRKLCDPDIPVDMTDS